MGSPKNISPSFRTEKVTQLSEAESITLDSSFLRVTLVMKLTIERLTSLSQQDHIDLAKIWPLQTVVQWQAWLDTPENSIFAARFNDRLLAAVKVTVAGEKGYLGDFNVRELTRRRGVGLYLLEDTLRQNPGITCWQINDDGVEAGQRAAWTQFLLAVGCLPNAQGWEKRGVF